MVVGVKSPTPLGRWPPPPPWWSRLPTRPPPPGGPPPGCPGASRTPATAWMRLKKAPDPYPCTPSTVYPPGNRHSSDDLVSDGREGGERSGLKGIVGKVPLARGFLSAVAFLGAEQHFPDHRSPTHYIWIGQPLDIAPHSLGDLPPVALTIATIPALIGSGRLGQVAITSARSGGAAAAGGDVGAGAAVAADQAGRNAKVGVGQACRDARVRSCGGYSIYWPLR